MLFKRTGKVFFLILIVFFSYVELIPGDTVSRYAKQLDWNIHYEVEGSGPVTLVFIHGWSCDSTFWRYQVPVFKDKYRVITIDLLGHGKSSHPDVPYVQDLFVDSVRSVLKGEEIEKAVLIGHSMGYAVARRFIMRYPKRAVGLCSVDGAYLKIPDDPSKIEEWIHRNREFAAGFRLEGDKGLEFMAFFFKSLFVPSSSIELQKEITGKMMSTKEYVRNSAMEEFMGAENWEDYSLDIPTLAVYAVSPDLPNDNESYLKKLFPKLEYHLWKDVGHFIMMEKADEFNQVLKNFLSKNFNK